MSWVRVLVWCAQRVLHVCVCVYVCVCVCVCVCVWCVCVCVCLCVCPRTLDAAPAQHNMWCKMSNFELGVRVPWMVHVPDVERCSGTHTPALAELVDVYPTLAELAGKIQS